MTESQLQPFSQPPKEGIHTISVISYVLHLIVAVSAVIPGGQMGPALLVVALILDLVKKKDAGQGWEASHFRFRIRTVWWVAVLYLVTLPLWFFFIVPGWIAWSVISVWFLYRIVWGWVRLNKQQAMED